MEKRSLYPLALYLANDRRERDYRQADLARRVRANRSGPSYSVRQAVGRLFVRLGERVAGESLELARSR